MTCINSCRFIRCRHATLPHYHGSLDCGGNAGANGLKEPFSSLKEVPGTNSSTCFGWCNICYFYLVPSTAIVQTKVLQKASELLHIKPLTSDSQDLKLDFSETAHAIPQFKCEY